MKTQIQAEAQKDFAPPMSGFIQRGKKSKKKHIEFTLLHLKCQNLTL